MHRSRCVILPTVNKTDIEKILRAFRGGEVDEAAAAEQIKNLSYEDIGYARVDHKNGLSELEIELKYSNGQPAIRQIKRISKPGRRVYSQLKDLPTVANGLGVAILSTPKGVMSDTRAREEKVGGEILCDVF